MLITSNHKRVVQVLNENKICEFSSLFLMEHSRGQLTPHSQSDISRELFHNFLLNIYILHMFIFFKTII